MTCGIYGAFMHTAFASDEAEGRMKYSNMKRDLVPIMLEEDNNSRYEMMSAFATKY